MTTSHEQSLADCIVYQISLDYRHVLSGALPIDLPDFGQYFGGQLLTGEFDSAQFDLKDVVTAMRAHVDPNELTRLAEHGWLLIGRDEHWSNIGDYDVATRQHLASMAAAVAIQFKRLAREDESMSGLVGAHLRVRTAICQALIGQLKSDLKIAKHGGAVKFTRFGEIYSQILAGLCVYEWRLSGCVEPVETILLVRE